LDCTDPEEALIVLENDVLALLKKGLATVAVHNLSAVVNILGLDIQWQAYYVWEDGQRRYKKPTVSHLLINDDELTESSQVPVVPSQIARAWTARARE
jgi:hypothetical protein